MVVHRARWIVLASLGLVLACVPLLLELRLRTDTAAMLPPGARSVRDLRVIGERLRPQPTVTVLVRTHDAVARDATARELRDRLTQLAPVVFDDRPAREFAWTNRWLFAPLADLERARDRLAERVHTTKLAANPLYVDLDDAPPTAENDAAADRELARQLDEARARYRAPPELVSNDGVLQMLLVLSPYAAGDHRARGLLDEIDEAVADIGARHPGVEIGLAGELVADRAEYATILDGMIRAALVATALVITVLALYLRSLRALAALAWSLLVATVVTFAVAQLVIGELNVATAFLSSIVVGNGVNPGIVVAARYLEERRRSRGGAGVLRAAASATLRGTLAASLAASVAYASLLVTEFRGFRHFAVIGGLGMVLCWIAAYTLLPATLAVLDRVGGLRPWPDPLGDLLRRAVPRSSTGARIVLAAVTVATAAAAIVAVRFVAGAPFEDDFRRLRSDSAQTREESRWTKLAYDAFGRGTATSVVIATRDAATASVLAARLRAADAQLPEVERLFARIITIDDRLPSDQPAKLRVLAEIRDLLSADALAAMTPENRALAEELRPPADLRVLAPRDVPALLAAPFTEVDGTRGRILIARMGKQFDAWNASDVLRFAERARALDHGEGTLVGAASFVYADVIAAISRDGRLATLLAMLGALVVIIWVLGKRRAAWVTLASTAAGTTIMVALAALVGMRVNFLDFIALPITIGIGVDYAANIAARAARGGAMRDALATAGSAVAVCSCTTIIGYGSLVLSQNLAVRSFGIAATLGEITCLAIAIVLVPVLWRRR